MQPWATLIALGAKRIETRSWSTPYRGPLAIHPSGRITKGAAMSLYDPLLRQPLAAEGYRDGNGPATNPFGLPLGAVSAVVTLIDVRRITTESVPAEPDRSV